MKCWERENIYKCKDTGEIQLNKYTILEFLGPSGPRLLAGGPSGLLASSIAPFGHSDRVTHAEKIWKVFRKNQSQIVGNTFSIKNPVDHIWEIQ